LIEVLIYPNPVAETLNISGVGEGPEISEILISNFLGEKISEIKNENSLKEIQINFKNSKSGIYFLEVRFLNGNFVSRKIVKE